MIPANYQLAVLRRGFLQFPLVSENVRFMRIQTQTANNNSGRQCASQLISIFALDNVRVIIITSENRRFLIGTSMAGVFCVSS